MEKTWEDWIRGTELHSFVRELCLLLPESTAVANHTHAQASILDASISSATGALKAHWKVDWRYGADLPSQWRANRTERSLEVRATLRREANGLLHIESECDCHNAQPCVHAQNAIVKLACDLRPDVGELLSDKRAMAAYRISTTAARLIRGVSSKPAVNSIPAVPNVQEQVLVYRLSSNNQGILNTLRICVARVLKSGSYSTAREVPVSPQEFQRLLGGAPLGGRFDYGFDLGAIAQPADHEIARHLFLAGGLRDGSSISLQELDAAEGWWAPLLQCGRLQIDEATPRAFNAGPILDLTANWERSSDGLWIVRPELDGRAQLVPTAPPKYVRMRDGAAGPIVGLGTQAINLLFRDFEGLHDEDLSSVREHFIKSNLNALAPPEIKVNEKHDIKPIPVLTFSWIPDDQSFDGNRVFRQRSLGRAKLGLHFIYADTEVSEPNGSTIEQWSGATKTVIVRDAKFEKFCLDRLRRACGTIKPYGYTFDLGRLDYFDQKGVERLVRFQRQSVPILVDDGWRVELSQWWPGREVRPEEFQSRFGEDVKGFADFSLTAKVDGHEIDMVDILKKILDDEELLAKLTSSTEFNWIYRLRNGYCVTLTSAELSGLLPLLKALRFNEKTGKARLSRFDVGALESARSAVDIRMTTPSSLVEISEQLRDSPTEPSSRTVSSLQIPARSHQAVGAGWCAGRRALGFGGVIADEYAVGKTLQTLLAIHDAVDETPSLVPSLVVVTKTLFFEGRWQSDIERFLPSLATICIGAGRYSRRLEDIGEAQLVITTYDVLSRCAEKFAEIPWNVVAFDEAHRLGNPRTKLYRAADSLRARQKLAITGSPMQNSPREMWGIMNLVVPGLLQEMAWFNKAFPRLHSTSTLNPDVEASKKAELAEKANRTRLLCLGKMISPFQLRRTNKELGRMLPPIVEEERRLALPQWQANIYEGLRVSTKAQVDSLLETNVAFADNKVHVFGLLLGLRQAACEPRLVKAIGSRAGDQQSAKAAALQDICEEFTADGKKVVIVSEWTEWLDMISAQLGAEGYITSSLTGKLTGAQRKSEIDRFRKGDAMVMLLQLSFAEGVELPEGDAIIVAAPWWNEKKIEQAIARLRRDEREKSISVIRLHVPGSVEEGVKRVAQRKLDDIEAVNEGGRTGSTILTASDIEAFFGLAQRADDE